MVARVCGIGVGDCGCNIAASVGRQLSAKDRESIEFQFLNTNWPSLKNLYVAYPFLFPETYGNLVVMGSEDPDIAGGGAGDDPATGLRAFELSKKQLMERLMAKNFQEYWVFFGTGKGTGSGAAYPLVKMLREELQKITFGYGVSPAPDIQMDEDCLDHNIKVFQQFDESGFLTGQLLNAKLFENEDLCKLPLVQAYDKANELLAHGLASVMRFTADPSATDLNDFRKNIYPGRRMTIKKVCIRKNWSVADIVARIQQCSTNTWHDINLSKVRAALIIVEGVYTMELEKIIGEQFRIEVRKMRGIKASDALTDYRQYVASYPSPDDNLYITAMFVDAPKNAAFVPPIIHGHDFTLPDLPKNIDTLAPVAAKSLAPVQNPVPVKRAAENAHSVATTPTTVALQPIVLDSVVPDNVLMPRQYSELPLLCDDDLKSVPMSTAPVEIELASSAPASPSLNGGGHAASVQKKLAAINGSANQKTEFSTLREMIKEASLNNEHARKQLAATPTAEFRAKVSEGKPGNSILECLDMLKQYHFLFGKEWKELCLQELREKVVLGEYTFYDPDGRKIALGKDVPMNRMKAMLDWDLHDAIKKEIRMRIAIVETFDFETLRSLNIEKKEIEKPKKSGVWSSIKEFVSKTDGD